ncbi:MAG: reverse transcriptase domain-containing protein [Desulfobacula sp.]|jgi:RNA-directed DNA polymerase|nr:reverse transcriptase domain-containing protein [Desulfobacula sp.]
MKKYNNLYSKIYGMENIKLAHKNAKKGKAHYSEVKMVDSDPDKYFNEIHEILKDKTFKNSKYKTFIKTDSGKAREIFKLPYFPDRIIHHCIMNILEPIWMKTLIADTYSSLKKRGIHKGVKRVKSALKDRKGTQYCLKMDVKKFYPSIDHNVLKQIIRKKIKDKDLLWILDEIIDSADGVPIGNYLSQYFGNLYLSGLDHWAKEQRHCKYYFRYCDDIVILHKDKNHLANLRKEISGYLKEKLNVTLKENWQVFPVAIRGIDFLGYRFFHDYALLRKSTAARFKKRIKRIKKSRNSLTPINILGGVMSYWGWMKHANCYRLQDKYIDEDIKQIVNNVCITNKLHNPVRCI